MSTSLGVYSKRVFQQKLNREKQKLNYQNVIGNDSDSDSDSTIYPNNENERELLDNDSDSNISSYNGQCC